MNLKDIQIRPIEDDDMVEVSEWFARRKWLTPPARGMLPKTGYVAHRGGKLLSVVWLYITNSQVAIVDWIATNPEAGYSSLVSVKVLLEHVERLSDATVFMHFTPNDKFAKFLGKKCGFKTTEKANICVRRRPTEATHG
jgi:hypothetical protein